MSLMTDERTGGASDAPPSIEFVDGAPSADEVRGIVGDIPFKCEVNGIHPCTKHAPQAADYIIVWERCNCNMRDKKYEGTTFLCKSDMAAFSETVNHEPWMVCPHCDFIFRPAHKMIRKVILL